ncbi:MAG: hypothetical protein R2912_02635 [Eubacteriales bacterium]
MRKRRHPLPRRRSLPLHSAAEASLVLSEPAASSFSLADRLKNNSLTDHETLRLVSMGSAIYLYAEPSTRSTRVRVANKRARRKRIYRSLEQTTADGRLFYEVCSTFSADAGYVLAKDTHESKLKSGAIGLRGRRRVLLFTLGTE